MKSSILSNNWVLGENFQIKLGNLRVLYPEGFEDIDSVSAYLRIIISRASCTMVLNAFKNTSAAEFGRRVF